MIGVLLINLGTPTAPTEAAVSTYLHDFLLDPYVIELPKVLRHFLVKKIILPFRPKKTAHAYQQIWTEQGSPLLINTLALQQKLSIILGSNYQVMSGMRHSKPSILDALTTLQACHSLIVLPLFPQFARATTQSVLEEVKQCQSQLPVPQSFNIISSFGTAHFFIDSLVQWINKNRNKRSEFLLMSYHGLPVSKNNGHETYYVDCLQTTESLANQLNLSKDDYAMSFQSRLGLKKWLQPYTTDILKQLRDRNIQHLSVVSPSFVTDCVETLEEINIRLRQQWVKMGGQTFDYIPCLNAEDAWSTALANFLVKF